MDLVKRDIGCITVYGVSTKDKSFKTLSCDAVQTSLSIDRSMVVSNAVEPYGKTIFQFPFGTKTLKHEV